MGEEDDEYGEEETYKREQEADYDFMWGTDLILISLELEEAYPCYTSAPWCHIRLLTV
jgi:hypothetical protein